MILGKSFLPEKRWPLRNTSFLPGPLSFLLWMLDAWVLPLHVYCCHPVPDHLLPEYSSLLLSGLPLPASTPLLQTEGSCESLSQPCPCSLGILQGLLSLRVQAPHPHPLQDPTLSCPPPPSPCPASCRVTFSPVKACPPSVPCPLALLPAEGHAHPRATGANG